jgi:hypothetical protein
MAQQTLDQAVEQFINNLVQEAVQQRLLGPVKAMPSKARRRTNQAAIKAGQQKSAVTSETGKAAWSAKVGVPYIDFDVSTNAALTRLAHAIPISRAAPWHHLS